MNQSLITIIFVLLFMVNSHAETIYKTVDEQGRTSYSAAPPESKKQTSIVEISPAPSEKHIEAAQQRHKRNINAAEIMDRNRTQRNEKIEEENRIKQERKKQLQQNRQAKDSNETQHYGYPYYPRPKPHNPVVSPPVYTPTQPAR